MLDHNRVLYKTTSNKIYCKCFNLSVSILEKTQGWDFRILVLVLLIQQMSLCMPPLENLVAKLPRHNFTKNIKYNPVFHCDSTGSMFFYHHVGLLSMCCLLNILKSSKCHEQQPMKILAGGAVVDQDWWCHTVEIESDCVLDVFHRSVVWQLYT